jgi:hypothetical protein
MQEIFRTTGASAFYRKIEKQELTLIPIDLQMR